MLDLARWAAQAASAIDHADPGLPEALQVAAGDLEYAFYATEREDHAEEALRILVPVLSRIGVIA